MNLVKVTLNPKKCEACKIAREHTKTKLKAFLDSTSTESAWKESNRVCIFHYRYFGIRKLLKSGANAVVNVWGNVVEYGAIGKYPITLLFEFGKPEAIVRVKHGKANREYLFRISYEDLVEVIGHHAEKVIELLEKSRPVENSIEQKIAAFRGGSRYRKVEVMEHARGTLHHEPAPL